MQNQDKSAIEDLPKFTVKIKAGRIIGAGVIVTDDGLILTCYHIIKHLKDKSAAITVYFPAAKVSSDANIIASDERLDVAFLQLKDKQLLNKLADDVAIAKLSLEVQPTNKFWTYGFRKSVYFDEGLGSSGVIHFKTRADLQRNRMFKRVIQLYSKGIEEGMSGAPVLDMKTNRVIGIISKVTRNPSKRKDPDDNTLVLAIPIESAVHVCKELEHKNLGLSKIYNFMETIGKENSLLYTRFNEVYVPPIVYPEIEKALAMYNCIFIVGTPEYGKTYTAIKILWEHYKLGYIPILVERNSGQKSDIIGKLRDQDKRLQKCIIYLEDPIGDSQYDPNPDFEKSIASIIAGLTSLKARLIITMRENIYQQFSPTENIDPNKYVKKLNLGSRPYDYERRKEMLRRWASIIKCKWITDKKLESKVLDYIKDESRLPTPLNIKDFVMDTCKDDLTFDGKQLLKMIDEKSISTPKSFANDIELMEKKNEIEKLLLLCFPFISENFTPEFVLFQYHELLEEISKEDSTYAFRKARTQLRDKVEFDLRVKFSHRSYSEALPLILLDRDGIPTKMREFFSKVLIHFADFDSLLPFWRMSLGELHRNVVRIVITNFFNLPFEVQNLIFKFADDSAKSGDVAGMVISHYNNLPEEVQNLIFKIADKEDTAKHVIFPIAENFQNLPADVQHLLVKFADNNERAIDVAWAINNHFDKLSEDTRNKLLIKLADRKEKADLESSADSVANAVMDTVYHRFDKLSEDTRNKLLIKLIDRSEIPHSVALDAPWIICENFNNLPKDVRNLIFKLAEDEYAAGILVSSIARYFQDLPKDVQNLLVRLAGRENTSADVALAIARYFQDLPKDVQNLLANLINDENIVMKMAHRLLYCDNIIQLQNMLVKFIDNEKIAESLAKAIKYNFNNLDQNIRNELLLNLGSRKNLDSRVAHEISYTIAEHYNSLSGNVQNLLLKFAEDSQIAENVASAIGLYINNLDESTRNKLLLKLGSMAQGNRHIAWTLSKVLIDNYNNISKDVQNVIFSLAADDRTAEGVCVAIATTNFGSFDESTRNKLLLKLADRGEEAAEEVSFIMKMHFTKLDESTRNNLLLKLADRGEKITENISTILAEKFKQLDESTRNNLLLKLSESEKIDFKTAFTIANIIAQNFYKLPLDIRNLLFKFANNDKTVDAVYGIMPPYFNNLDESTRNNLLLKLSESEKIDPRRAYAVALTIIHNLQKIPLDIRNLLYTLAYNENTQGFIALPLILNFQNLPQELQNFVFELARNEKTAPSVLMAINTIITPPLELAFLINILPTSPMPASMMSELIKMLEETKRGIIDKNSN